MIEDGGIVNNAPDAERIAEAMKLLPHVLLREDDRVKAAFAVWWSRMARCEDAITVDGAAPLAVAVRSLVDDAAELFALVRSLGLDRCRWLPQMLRWEFQRRVEEIGAGSPVPLEVTLPDRLPWDGRGRAPKRGKDHREDMAQYIAWLYRAKIRQPPLKITALAAEYIEEERRAGVHIREGRAQVKNGIKRAQQFLDCIQ